MARPWSGWIVAGALSGLAAYAIAEEITLTTYYPSPRGVYEELRTTSDTYLAMDKGRVGIGTTTPGERLEVAGGIRLNPAAPGLRKPACAAEKRGTLWFSQNVKVGQATVDQLEFCAQVNGQHRWVVVSGMLEP